MCLFEVNFIKNEDNRISRTRISCLGLKGNQEFLTLMLNSNTAVFLSVFRLSVRVRKSGPTLGIYFWLGLGLGLGYVIVCIINVHASQLAWVLGRNMSHFEEMFIALHHHESSFEVSSHSSS